MRERAVLVLGGYDRSLVLFRGKLLAAMHAAGWQVTGAAPAEDINVPAELGAMGASFQAVPMARAGIDPRADAQTFFSCLATVTRVRPKIFLGYTLKPVTYGCLAAWAAGVPRIYAMITGLGSAFLTKGAKGFLLSIIAGGFYRLALRPCAKVFVQNAEIAAFLVKEGIIGEPEKIVVVPGSGVDLHFFRAEPIPTGAPRFLFLGRFLRDKGVFELVDAARRVRAAHPEARIVMVGGPDANSGSVSPGQIAQWREEGVVTIEDPVRDVRPHLRACMVYVLPSYHEGLPRSVLEAMATGRPIITTDTIGCRETVRTPGGADATGVRWGSNGALVPVGDSAALAASMLRLIREPDRRVEMGRESRLFAEQTFDVERVNAQMMAEMEINPARAPLEFRPAI